MVLPAACIGSPCLTQEPCAQPEPSLQPLPEWRRAWDPLWSLLPLAWKCQHQLATTDISAANNKVQVADGNQYQFRWHILPTWLDIKQDCPKLVPFHSQSITAGSHDMQAFRQQLARELIYSWHQLQHSAYCELAQAGLMQPEMLQSVASACAAEVAQSQMTGHCAFCGIHGFGNKFLAAIDAQSCNHECMNTSCGCSAAAV